jgi:hypothetical protein
MTAYTHERAKPRYCQQLPVIVAATPKNSGPRGVTRDVSETGVYFYTDTWKAHTRQFEFRMVVPREITGADSRRALCRATVVRVDESAGAKIGVAARIDEIVWM